MLQDKITTGNVKGTGLVGTQWKGTRIVCRASAKVVMESGEEKILLEDILWLELTRLMVGGGIENESCNSWMIGWILE